jgi:hypothetical protein
MKFLADLVLFAGVGTIMVKPSIVFNTIEKYAFNKDISIMGRDIFNEPLEHNVLAEVGTCNNIEAIERDEVTMKNLDRMVANTKSPYGQQVWKIKREEFLRSLRWKTVGGTENHSMR